MRYPFPFLLLLLSFNLTVVKTQAQLPLYKSAAFSVFKDKVNQGQYEAKAISATHITSNYKSPANLKQPASISFKFAINGKDNEMPPGQDHLYTVQAISGKAETPLIKFGKQ